MAFDVLTNCRNGIMERSAWLAVARLFIISLFWLICASQFFDLYFRFLFVPLNYIATTPFSLETRKLASLSWSNPTRGPERSRGSAAETRPQMMFELQKRGCLNAKFVTPEHGVSQIPEALLSPCRWALDCGWWTAPIALKIRWKAFGWWTTWWASTCQTASAGMKNYRSNTWNKKIQISVPMTGSQAARKLTKTTCLYFKRRLAWRRFL